MKFAILSISNFDWHNLHDHEHAFANTYAKYRNDDTSSVKHLSLVNEMNYVLRQLN